MCGVRIYGESSAFVCVWYVGACGPVCVCGVCGYWCWVLVFFIFRIGWMSNTTTAEKPLVAYFFSHVQFLFFSPLT